VQTNPFDMSTPGVDKDGYVINAFFKGPTAKVNKILVAMGKPVVITQCPVMQYTITPADKVTISKLRRLYDLWMMLP
jgi:hypothetical protein